MKKRTNSLLTVLLSLMLIGSPLFLRAYKKGMGGLEGFLYAEDGTTAVSGAEITLKNVSSQEIHRVQTDENGIFRVDSLENGFYVYGVTTPRGQYNSDNMIGIRNGEMTKVSIVLDTYDDRTAAAANEIYRGRDADDEALIGRVERYDPLTRVAEVFIIYGFIQKNDRIHVEGRRTEFYQDVFDLNLENRPADRIFAGNTARIRMERDVEKGDEVYILCKKSGALPLFLTNPCGIAALVAGAGFISLGIIELNDEVSVSPFKTKR